MIDTIFILTETLLIICIVLTIYLQIRSLCIYNYRQALLDKVATRARRNIADNKPFLYLYDWFDRISYDTMFYRFWVWPLSRFYPDAETKLGV